MRLESKKSLHDVHAAAELIRRFTTGRSEADFESDAMLRSAVERQFEIIGEAIGRLVKVDPTMADRISEYRKIVSFRNVLIHGYDVISNDITWKIVQEKLPILITEVGMLLSEPETP